MGRCIARMRVVRLGGPEVRKARRNAADAHEGGDVFMYRDSSAALLLDLRRRAKAVMDVLDAMASLWHDRLSSRLSGTRFFGWAQSILFLERVWSWLGVVGACRRVMGDLHCRLSDFIHRVVVHRRDEAIRRWRNWFREGLFVRPCRVTWWEGGFAACASWSRRREEYEYERYKFWRRCWGPGGCEVYAGGPLDSNPGVGRAGGALGKEGAGRGDLHGCGGHD